MITGNWLSGVSPLKLIEPQYNTLPLAVTSVFSALLAHILYRYPKLRTLYSFPLYHISGITYILALFGALYLLDKSDELIILNWIIYWLIILSIDGLINYITDNYESIE